MSLDSEKQGHFGYSWKGTRYFWHTLRNFFRYKLFWRAWVRLSTLVLELDSAKDKGNNFQSRTRTRTAIFGGRSLTQYIGSRVGLSQGHGYLLQFLDRAIFSCVNDHLILGIWVFDFWMNLKVYFKCVTSLHFRKLIYFGTLPFKFIKSG